MVCFVFANKDGYFLWMFKENVLHEWIKLAIPLISRIVWAKNPRNLRDVASLNCDKSLEGEHQ